MDIFTERTWLKRAVFALICLNIGIVGLGLWKIPTQKPAFPPEKGGLENFEQTTEFLKKELNLSPTQVREMLAIYETYHDKQKNMILYMIEKRDSMGYATFGPKMDTTYFLDLAHRMADYNYQLNLIRLEQAQAFRMILTPEQDTKLSALFDEVQLFFRPRLGGKDAPPPSR